MAYDTTEERLKVRGSEQITRDLKVNRDAFISDNLEAGRIDDKGGLKVAGEIIANDDVTISGDLYVNGTEYINDAETAQTTDNYLVLRHNQTTPLGTDEYSGVAVHNYASGKTTTITTDKDGIWRVADNTETDTNYTDISYYNGTFYTGLTRTAATVISGIKTAFDEDELDESVYYNNSYYHFDGNNWFPVSLVDNKLTLGSAVIDSATITALGALTKYDLVYFRTLTVTVINEVENQPLLTRAEVSDLNNGQALIWDSTNQKAVGKTIDTTVTSGSSNLITSGAVHAHVTDIVDSLDVAEVGGTNKYIFAISETNGKITANTGNIDTTVTANSNNLVTSGAVADSINALNVNDTAVEGQYVSAVSETNGIISVTRTVLPDGSLKMDKDNPTGTGSFSLNRKTNTTIGRNSFAEGSSTTASGIASHAEGMGTTASDNYSHAEGSSTTAKGSGSHAEGAGATASGASSHAEGDNTTASGRASHAEGLSTTASGNNQHVQGKYNVASTTWAFVIGGGTGNSSRKNILAFDWNGNLHIFGDIYVHCNDDGTGGTMK